MDAQAWTDFFKAAGLGPDVAASYGSIFFAHKIERSHLPHLSREVLGEMNISVLGHVLTILKHARLVSDRLARSVLNPSPATDLCENKDEISPAAASTQERERAVEPVQHFGVPQTSAHLSSLYAESVTDTQSHVQQCQLDLRRRVHTGSSVKYSDNSPQRDPAMESNETTAVDSYGMVEEDNSTYKNLDPGITDSDSSCNSQPLKGKKNEDDDAPVKSSDVDGVEETDDSSEPHSSLLPTPVMPQNWLDPSRKHFESGADLSTEGTETSATCGGRSSTLEGRNDGDESEEEENNSQIPPILPEKICSPLLPTPVMPENWLDPSRKSTESNIPFWPDRDQTSQFLQPMRNEFTTLPGNSLLPETNVNLGDSFVPPSSGTIYAEQPCSQIPMMFPSDDNRQSESSSAFDASGQQYTEYNDQAMQDRNFKPKLNTSWNKQARQTQPYYRPQPQVAYGISNYSSQPNERPDFQTGTPGTISSSPGYMSGAQSAEERTDVYQWKH